jgi:DNA helicase-2/ATP-dependent DNA helicase PcrA
MIDDLLAAADHYAARTDQPSLSGFLDEATLSDRSEETDKEEKLSRRAVKLMTVHGAKGLEFPCVFLVGLEEGLLPHRKAVEDSEAAIVEERRLCYVGITRARDRLVVSRAQTRKKWGKRRVSAASRFWFEMQEAPAPVMGAPDGHGAR